MKPVPGNAYFPYDSQEHERQCWLRDVWLDQLRHPEERVLLKPRGDGYYDWSVI